MITTQQLSEAFGRNVALLKQQADGLSHADSLRQPPFRGNCLNWVLGHLAGNRDAILQALGAKPVLDAAADRYARESDPITGDGPGVLPLEELLAILTRSQEALAAALARTTEEDLAKEIEGEDVILGPFDANENLRVVFIYKEGLVYEFMQSKVGKDWHKTG